MTHPIVDVVHIQFQNKRTWKTLEKMNYKGYFDKDFGNYCPWHRIKEVPWDTNTGIDSTTQQCGSY